MIHPTKETTPSTPTTTQTSFKKCTELKQVYPTGVSSSHPAYQKKFVAMETVMPASKYTLDRIENEQYVFVKKGKEEIQIVIDGEFIPFDIQEGEIVEIVNENDIYTFKKLEMEKEIRKDNVQSLIDKLKKRN